MHYAVPALLARSNALAAFYTDLHSSHRPFQLLKGLWSANHYPKPLKRLYGRSLPPDLPRELVRDQPFASLTWARRGAQSDALVLERACRERFGGASAVYTNFINNDIDAIRQAKDQGLHVVHELIISADVGRIMLEERQRFPGIEPACEALAEVEAGIARDQQKWTLSDQVLVPSEYCLQSSIALGCDPEKISLVPYGIPEHWFGLQSDPQQGRILFVGQVGLRKGNHVLAEACRLLKTRGVHFECRVAGPLQVDTTLPLFEGPTYLGQVPRSQVQEEFRCADIFVLPTLAEGMALVQLEAMASGLPVITTPHSGTVVRDGIDGFIVPIRDALALADRIQQMLDDRALRDRLAKNSKERAREFGWSNYYLRLINALPK